MLSNFSWPFFGLFAGGALVLFYAAVLLIFFREEVKSFFNKTSGIPSPRTDADDLVGRLAPEPGMSNVPLDELDFGREDLLHGQVPDLLEELKWFFDQAANDEVAREEVPNLLRPVLELYAKVFNSDLSASVRSYIQAECLEALGYELSEKELEDCFPKSAKSSGGKHLAAGLAVLLVLSQMQVHAQDGNAGIQQATTLVQGYFSTGCTLMYAIGAVVGIVGAIKVFQKWNAGEPDTGKVAAAWFGSCIFLVVVATVIKSFFGL